MESPYPSVTKCDDYYKFLTGIEENAKTVVEQVDTCILSRLDDRVIIATTCYVDWKCSTVLLLIVIVVLGNV